MNFKKIRDLLLEQQNYQREQHSMNGMESRARNLMRSATANGALDDPKTQRLVSQARTELDLVESRRGHVETRLAECFTELKREAIAVAREYNGIVKARREARRAEIEDALRPFMDGNKRELEIILNSCNWPCLYDISRAGWPGINPADADDLASQVSNFKRHARKFAKLCNLDIGAAAED